MLISLVDLGQAQWIGKQPTVDEFTAPALSAPEVILQSSFGPGPDIWSIRCITLKLLTGHWLFHPEEGEDWLSEDAHLTRMMEVTGERFTPDILEHARKHKDYFDDNGNLLRISEIFLGSITSALGNYSVLARDAIQSAAEFIASCLRFDPLK